MRKLICCIFLALSLAAAHAEDKDLHLFNRCGPMDVVVSVDDNAERLTNVVTRAETMAKSRLSAARIYKADIYPEIFVTVHMAASSPYIYRLGFQFQKKLTDEYGNKMVGEVYERGSFGVAPDIEDVTDNITNGLSEYLDEFVLKYLEANEGYCK